MSIQVSWDGFISVSSIDLSDHCVQITLNDGEESRDVTAFGDTSRRFRAGMGTASIEATFLNDLSTGSVENTLRTHLLAQNSPGTLFPSSSPSLALGGSSGGMIAGTYRYWATYTFPAFETAPSTYASIVIASSTEGSVLLTSIPASTEWFVTGKKLYRSTANGGTSTGILLTSLVNTATSYLDNASSSSLSGNALLNTMWQPVGFDVVVRKHDTAATTNNPQWTLTALIDGDLNSLDEKPGELPQMKVKFAKYGTFTMVTT